MQNASPIEVLTFAIAVSCASGIATNLVRRRHVRDWSRFILFGTALVFVVNVIVAMQVPTASAPLSYVANAMRIIGVLLVTLYVVMDSQRG